MERTKELRDPNHFLTFSSHATMAHHKEAAAFCRAPVLMLAWAKSKGPGAAGKRRRFSTFPLSSPLANEQRSTEHSSSFCVHLLASGIYFKGIQPRVIYLFVRLYLYTFRSLEDA